MRDVISSDQAINSNLGSILVRNTVPIVRKLLICAFSLCYPGHNLTLSSLLLIRVIDS